MSTTIRELFVKLGVDADDKKLKQFDSGINQAKSGMMGLVKAAGLVGAAFTGAFLFAKNIANAGDAAEKTAKNAGIASEELQKLQYAATIGGVSNQELTVSLKTLNKNAYEAAKGSASFVEAFADLGIKVTDSNGKIKTADVLLGELADSFQNMEDPAKKAALAQTLMGRSGFKMVTVLKDGKAGLEALKKEFEATGAMINEKTRKDAEQFNDDLFRMNTALQGLKISLGKDLLPMFIRLFNKMRDGIIEFRKTYVETGKLQEGLKSLVKWSTIFITLWAVSSVGNIFVGIGKSVMALVGIYRTLGITALATQLKMLAMPLLVGAAVLFFTGLIIELYNLIFTDKKTVFHYMLEDLKTIVAYWKSEIENSSFGKFFGIDPKSRAEKKNRETFEKANPDFKKNIEKATQSPASKMWDSFKNFVTASPKDLSARAGEFYASKGIGNYTPDPARTFGAGYTKTTNITAEINIDGSGDPVATGQAVKNAIAALQVQEQ